MTCALLATVLAGCDPPDPPELQAPGTAALDDCSTPSSRAIGPAPESDWVSYHRTPDRAGVDVTSPSFRRLTEGWSIRVDGPILAGPLVARALVQRESRHRQDPRPGEVARHQTRSTLTRRSPAPRRRCSAISCGTRIAGYSFRSTPAPEGDVGGATASTASEHQREDGGQGREEVIAGEHGAERAHAEVSAGKHCLVRGPLLSATEQFDPRSGCRNPCLSESRDSPPLSRQRDWSGRWDSNPRPPGPKPGALPGCATPRAQPRF